MAKHDFVIRDADWTVITTSDLPADRDGDCSHAKHRIRIQARLRGKTRMWTIAHEVLHAALPDIAEDAVDGAAFSIAEILWELGYRKKK